MNRTHSLLPLLMQLWRLLPLKYQRSLYIMLIASTIGAGLEMISIGSVLPFLAVLSAPNQPSEIPWIKTHLVFWGQPKEGLVIQYFLLLFVIFAFLSGAARMALLWASTKLGTAIGAHLSAKLYRNTLFHPYSTHIARNSSELISTITQKINIITFGIVQPVIMLATSTLVLLAVTCLLIIITPIVAIFSAVILALLYLLIATFTQRQLRKNSEVIAKEQPKVIKALREGLGGIRDILINGTQEIFCNIYRASDKLVRKAEGSSQFISTCPKYAMDTFGMVAIAALAYWLSQGESGIADSLPVLGALAIGAQRLLPLIQQIYSSWAIILGSQESLKQSLKLFDFSEPSFKAEHNLAPLPFNKYIRLKNVSFQYDSGLPYVVNDLNLTILKGSRVGIVGATGSGKSTLLDILMGLLQPSKGEISVDDEALTNTNLRAWQQNIAHVPQAIYLADTSIAENIAFGVDKLKIDMKKVRSVAAQAQIDGLIDGLRLGYDETVGERGVKLSGGQRQRIGVARALYKDSKVLIFDEATSALDNNTESQLISAIESISSDVTVIQVAHRVTTLQNCDLIIALENGEVASIGTYRELIDNIAKSQTIQK